jgi:hypothetical protein
MPKDYHPPPNKQLKYHKILGLPRFFDTAEDAIDYYNDKCYEKHI